MVRMGVLAVSWVFVAAAGVLAEEVRVPLSVHQALRKGVDGVACEGVPVTVGLPFARGAVKEVKGRPALAVKGVDAFQFRTLRKWPDGSVAWALADFQADLEAGKVSSAYAVVPGAGVTAGPDLAAVKGDVIEVNTGPLTAVIRRKGFNLLDAVAVNGVVVISPTGAGLLCYGPDGNAYSAANDPGATVTIEENGPVRCVVKAEGAHRDAAGSKGHRRCFGWTVRMHFYKGSAEVRVFHTLKNGSREQLANAKTTGAVMSLAVKSASATAATPDGSAKAALPARALQGHNGFPKAMGIKKAQTGSAVGFTLTGADKTIAKTEGAKSLGPDLMWLDAARPDGAGAAAGVRFAMGWFPKAIAADGEALTVECWPKDNDPGYFFRFGAHATTEVLLVFHDKALTDMPARMNRFQYRPIAKAPVAHYNAADVFPLRLDRWVTFAQELKTYEDAGLFASHKYDTKQRMSAHVRPAFRIWRYHYWGAGGGLNQHDFARIALINGHRRRGAPQEAGQMYLEGEQRFQYNADFCVQHYDDFPAARACTNPYSRRHHQKDAIHLHGMKGAPINNAKVVFEAEHPHWYGMLLYYYTTGDERIREAVADWADTTRVGPRNRVPDYTRFFGWGMRTLMEMAEFFDDPAFMKLADAGRDNLLKAHQEADGKTVVGHNWDRGFTLIQRSRPGGIICKPFMDGYIVWDNLYYYLLHHPKGRDGRYWLSDDPQIERLGDLLMNNVEFFYNEAWFEGSDPPVAGPNGHGMPYTFPLYKKNKKRPPTWQGYGDREVWNLWAIAYRWTGERRFLDRGKACLAKVAVCNGGSYWSQDHPGVQRLLWLMNHPKADATPPAAVQDLAARAAGDGAVALTWTAPADADAYQIKTGDRAFVETLGYDTFEMTFKHDPKRFMPWPAGANVSDEPKPTPGAKQTHTITGLKPGAAVYVALRSWDAADNRSAISNVVRVEVK